MKTEHLFKKYFKILNENSNQDVNPEDGFETDGNLDVTDVQDTSVESDIVPMTSEGENQYIKDLIDAALFVPTSQESKTLTDLQSIMTMKKFQNARDEILPLILDIIKPSTENSEISHELNQID